MGEPIKIVDLANSMKTLAGREEIKIEFIGLREGEKLYEELLINENDKKTKYKSIFVSPKTTYNFNALSSQISILLKNKNKIEILKEIVPEFVHKRDNL
jgi:FlaA1/EpsC-like NDP-sugar epimerase